MISRATMSLHDSFHLLASKLAAPSHVKGLEQLSDLQIKSLLTLLRVELGNLALDLLHDSQFTFIEFTERTDGIVPRFRLLSMAQRLHFLLNFADQTPRNLLLGTWDNEVQELFIGNYRLVVICHQID